MRINFVELRAATVLIVAALASFGTALAGEDLFGAGSSSLPVLAVVLALSLGRAERGSQRRHRLVNLARVPLVGLGAGLVAALLHYLPPVGAAVFVLGLSGAIWVRRFGRAAARAGRLATLPLIALIVTPVPPHANDGAPFWVVTVASACVALLAACWVTVIQLAAERLGWLPPPPAAALVQAAVPAPPAAAIPPTKTAPSAQVTPPAPPVQPTPPANSAPRSARKRLPASTRMATQMAIALTLAFALGAALSPKHFGWVVLTAYIVSSGNRGRADVVWKGVLRLAGAAGGTVLATAIGHAFAPGDARAVIAIFALLWIGSWLRAINYAFWAAGMTAVLALLYDYYGDTGPDLLPQRLAAILLGSLIAVGTAWFVLPVPTNDVARKRFGGALASLSDLLAQFRDEPEAARASAQRFGAGLAELEQIATPLRAYRWLHRTRQAHLADAIDALQRCAPAVDALLEMEPDTVDRRELGEVRKLLGATRRALSGREPAPIASTHQFTMTALQTLDAELSTVRRIWLAFPRRAAAGVAPPPAAPRSDAAPA